MTEHVFDDLPRLLSGEADRATVVTVAAHLRECTDCRDELISAVVAHAALMSSVRFAPALAASGEATVAPAQEPLPDLSPVFAQIRLELAEQDTPVRGTRFTGHRRTLRYGLAAAVVALGLTGGSVYLAERGGSSAATTRSVALHAYGVGTSSAQAELVGSDQMVLDASSLPALGDGRYYEVWLTNSARTAMAPVGQLDATGKGKFIVPASEMTTYAAIEVSVQATHGVGNYSGESVLRGSYA